MREAFGEFYAPDAEDEARFTEQAHIAFDTNVLLDLYRLSAQRRAQVLGVLDKVKDRVWIPYQVGLEYQRNRIALIENQAGFYNSLTDLAGDLSEPTLRRKLDALNLPVEVKDAARHELFRLAEGLANAASDFRDFATELRDEHVVTPDIANDPVRDRLDEIFAGRVGTRPSDDDHARAVKDGLARIEKKIPPGYEDVKKDSDDRKAGDYLVWSQMLTHAASVSDDGRPFLFVTNDVKKDWYKYAGGEPIGPLPELRREFASVNSNGYHQVTLDAFLELSNQHLATSVSQDTIETATELRRTSSSEEQPDFSSSVSPGSIRFPAWGSLKAGSAGYMGSGMTFGQFRPADQPTPYLISDPSTWYFFSQRRHQLRDLMKKKGLSDNDIEEILSPPTIEYMGYGSVGALPSQSPPSATDNRTGDTDAADPHAGEPET